MHRRPGHCQSLQRAVPQSSLTQCNASSQNCFVGEINRKYYKCGFPSLSSLSHTPTHTCTHKHALAHISTYTHARVHTYANTGTHACMPKHMPTDACVYVHARTYTRVHAVYTHTGACSHSNMHNVYAHTCMHTHVGALLSYRKDISAPNSHLPCTQLLFISFVVSPSS